MPLRKQPWLLRREGGQGGNMCAPVSGPTPTRARTHTPIVQLSCFATVRRPRQSGRAKVSVVQPSVLCNFMQITIRSDNK